MKVLRVKPDFEFIQVNWPVNNVEAYKKLASPMFYGRPMADKWPRDWIGHIVHPELPRGNFFDVALGALGLFPDALEVFKGLLEPIAELLPLELPSFGECAIANITFVSAEAFDNAKGTKRVIEGMTFEPLRYAFHSEVISEFSLFKIPEIRSDILCVSGNRVPADRDFVRLYHDNNMSGLTFDVLWESE